MATHRVTVELSDSAYQTMQRLIETEGFSSESELLEDAVCQQHIAAHENAATAFSPWSVEEVDALLAEDDAHPEESFTLDQVREHLARKRGSLVEAA